MGRARDVPGLEVSSSPPRIRVDVERRGESPGYFGRLRTFGTRNPEKGPSGSLQSARCGFKSSPIFGSRTSMTRQHRYSPSGRARLNSTRSVMLRPHQYKPTLFDRHGAAAADLLRAAGYGVMVFTTASTALSLELGFHLWIVGVALGAGILAGTLPLLFARAVGGTWKRVMMDGSSTPYREQFSYQQSLVMRGRLDEALESFEAVILEQPHAADVRIKAAELYASEKHDYRRALELFRDAQKLPTVTPGEDVYVTNRIVDLLTGPLDTPGRALVELRRLIERLPGSAAADNARTALATLKARLYPSD
jgi:hypothetical protein